MTAGTARIVDVVDAARLIDEASSVLLLSHVNPDADTLGAALAVGAWLDGKRTPWVSYNETGVPAYLRFLPGADRTVTALPHGPFGLVAAFDNGSVERFGEAVPARWRELGRVLVIDHHITGINFGDDHLVDTSASSTCELTFRVLRHLLGGAKPDAAIADNIFAGLVVDTGSFRYSNTTPAAMETGRACIEAGADPWKINTALFESEPHEKLKLLGRVLDTLEFADDRRTATMVVTHAMIAAVGANEEMLEGFVNYPRSIAGVEVAALLKEAKDGRWRVSLRSKGLIDVAAVAQRFGGGGHRNASGLTLTGSLDAARAALAAALSAAYGSPA